MKSNSTISINLKWDNDSETKNSMAVKIKLANVTTVGSEKLLLT